jgi:hypothetical protein
MLEQPVAISHGLEPVRDEVSGNMLHAQPAVDCCLHGFMLLVAGSRWLVDERQHTATRQGERGNWLRLLTEHTSS